MHVETSTEHIHTITVTATQDEPFVLATRNDEQVVVKSVVVSVTTLDDGTVRPIQTSFRAKGVALNQDGKPGRDTRRFDAGNLNRLPEDVRDAVLAETDRLGVTGLREDLVKTAKYLRRSEA